MFTRTRIAIVTLAATGFALSAAGPANAIPSDYVAPGEYQPVTEKTVIHQPVGKKSCTVETTGPDGKKTTTSYPPGSTITINGKTYECQDGTWMPTAPIGWINPAGDNVYEAADAYLDSDATLVVVNQYENLSYSNDDSYYAAP